MHLTREGKFVRTDVWREGKWLDLWSVVHFLSGMSIGFVAVLAPFGAVANVTIVFLLLVVYEMWEALVKIEETPQNRFMDVVVGMASFLPTYFFLADIFPRPYALGVVTALVIALNITLATIGWLASQKAAVLEKNLLAEYHLQKTKLKERRHQKRIERAARAAAQKSAV